MDDFGTGYSSLSTLQTFPIDKIKIDRTFIRNITTSAQSQAILKSTIALGRALNIDVLAEGVETAADLDFLKKEGCNQAQGFLFGKPTSPGMLELKKASTEAHEPLFEDGRGRLVEHLLLRQQTT